MLIYKEETITPEKATALLNTMDRNRPVNWSRVHKYANDIKNGDFVLSNDFVAIDPDGRLTNGQHRMYAVKESGIATNFNVVYNLPEESVIDTPLVRKTGDSLYMRGLLDKKMSRQAIISTVNAYFTCKLGYKGSREITDTQKGRFINEHEENLLFAASVVRKGASKAVLHKSGCQAGVFAAAECGVNKDCIESLCEKANTGFYDDSSESAAIALRNTLIDPLGGGERSQLISASAIEQAIRDFVAKTPRKKSYVKINHVYIDRCPATI